MLGSLNGDDITRLYDRHAEAILAFFVRRTYASDVAVDLLAETFAVAFEDRRQFRGRGEHAARAWLFAIARHQLHEAVRSLRIQDEARRALAMQPIELDEGAIEILEAAASAPAIELLETLTPDQREAIEAHHVEERGYAEIAAELQCSESVVRKRVSRGLAALRAQLPQERPHA
jgi:RNA polymerase sigma factor (sigma-70 family)